MQPRKIFLLIILGCFCILSMHAIKPDKKYRFYPEKLGLIYKELDVTTKDSLNIKTWFFPAQNKLSEEALEKAWTDNEKRAYQTLDEMKRPTLIICDSDAGNMSWIHLHLAQEITKLGINVVTFDWRDFGESSEWPMDSNYMSYTEMLWDYEAVIDRVTKENEVDPSKIIVMGWSTGSYLSMITAYNNPLISAYIGIATPSGFEELLPILKIVQDKKDENLIVPQNFPSNQMPVYIASEFDKSTFLIVGELDDRTPPFMSENIYNLLPQGIKKDLWIVRGAEHGGMASPVTYDFEKFIIRIDEFIKDIFKET